MITQIADIYRQISYPVLRKITKLEKKPVIYTIGARDGLPSTRLQFLHRHNAIISIGFEPDPEEAARLERNNTLSRVLPYAVGRISGKAALYLTRMRGASSLYKPDIKMLSQLTPIAQEFEVEKEVEVELKRLDELMESCDLPRPEMIHIDAQASEMDIIEGLGKYLKNVSVITLETQIYAVYQKQILFHDIVEKLWNEGFVCCQIDDPNNSPVFSPYFVEANVSFVNLDKLRAKCDRTQLLMELARLGERANSKWKSRIYHLINGWKF